MNFNIDSFTDEQLLNLVNNSIINKTNYCINDFTGGYIMMTSTRKHTKETYEVVLMFGFTKTNNPKSESIEIQKDLIYIWTKALLLKISSIKLDNTGMSFNDINSLMNEKKEENNKKNGEKGETSYDNRTNSYPTSTYTQLSSTSLPNTYSNNSTNISDWLTMKKFILKNKKANNGTSIQFLFEDKIVCISDKDIPYFKNKGSSPSLSFQESDRFYQYLFKNLDKTLAFITTQQQEHIS